jgi:hypothetical protein
MSIIETLKNKQQQKLVQLKLAVYRSNEKVQVINIKTGKIIDAFGFDQAGLPVTEPYRQCAYRITGGHSGNVYLNSVFRRGLLPNNEKDQNKKVYGWAAIQLQLQRAGPSIDVKKLQEETEKLIKDGVATIHYCKLSNLLGIQDNNKQNDEWVIMGEAPETPDYDIEWTPLLKTLKSEWRIATEKMREAFATLTIQRATEATADI